MTFFMFALNDRLVCHVIPLLAAVSLAQWMLACHVSAQPGPITFRVDPRRSNLTWDSEIPPKEGQLASVVVTPGGFPLAGTVTVDVIECTDIRTSFNITLARISNTSLTGITPAGRPAPASIAAQANATGTIAAFAPTLNLSSAHPPPPPQSFCQSRAFLPLPPLSPLLRFSPCLLLLSVCSLSFLLPHFALTTSAVPPFAIDQTYGSFQSAWTVPTATWRAVRGFFAPSRDFGGGPFSASNLTAPLASFGFVHGHLNTVSGTPDHREVAANQSQVHLFINSTAVFTARQLLLTANASASIMNIVMGQGHVRMRILLTGLADNPCAVAPTPPSPRSRP
ncbi:unnamed protein product [Closterium sp. NIES-65]|nr:unnamed protein product [Closterium sp. NIES-65]